MNQPVCTPNPPEFNTNLDSISVVTVWDRSNPFIRASRKSGSRKHAIFAMCAWCVGCTPEAEEPLWRRDISDCRATRCPLWRFRPFQREAANGDS